jgi:hypothetical protein
VGRAEKGYLEQKVSHRSSARVLPMLTHDHVFFAKIAGKQPATLVVSNAAQAAALIHPLTCFFVPSRSIDFLFAQTTLHRVPFLPQIVECNERIDFSLFERTRTMFSLQVIMCARKK